MHWGRYHWQGYGKITLKVWSLLRPWTRFSLILIIRRLGQYQSLRNEKEQIRKYRWHRCRNKNRNPNRNFPKTTKITQNQLRSWCSWIHSRPWRKFRYHYWSHYQTKTYSWTQNLRISHFPWFLNRNKIYVWRYFIVFNIVSQCKVWPASIRLVDNQQFVFGMSLKT